MTRIAAIFTILF